MVNSKISFTNKCTYCIICVHGGGKVGKSIKGLYI